MQKRQKMLGAAVRAAGATAACCGPTAVRELVSGCTASKQRRFAQKMPHSTVERAFRKVSGDCSHMHPKDTAERDTDSDSSGQRDLCSRPTTTLWSNLKPYQMLEGVSLSARDVRNSARHL